MPRGYPIKLYTKIGSRPAYPCWWSRHPSVGDQMKIFEVGDPPQPYTIKVEAVEPYSAHGILVRVSQF